MGIVCYPSKIEICHRYFQHHFVFLDLKWFRQLFCWKLSGGLIFSGTPNIYLTVFCQLTQEVNKLNA